MGAVATEDAPDGLIPKQLEDAGAGGTDIDQGAVADGVTACNLQCASLEVGHAGEIVDAGKLEGPFACLREGVRSADGGGHDERAGGRGNVGGEDQLGAGAGDEASSGQGRETVDPLAAEVCNTPPERIVRTRPSAIVTAESAAELNRRELRPKFCERMPE